VAVPSHQVVALTLACIGAVSLLLHLGVYDQLETELDVSPSLEQETNPLVGPGPAWVAGSPEELAAAAAESFAVTAGPPAVAPRPYVPLLAHLRQRRAGIHHLGSKAPVRGTGLFAKPLVPHVRAVPDVWRQQFGGYFGGPTSVVMQATVTAMPLDTPSMQPPLSAQHAQPLAAPQEPIEHVVVDLTPPWQLPNLGASATRPGAALQAIKSIDFNSLHASVTFLFAAAAILALATQAYRLLYPMVALGHTLSNDKATKLDEGLGLELGRIVADSSAALSLNPFKQLKDSLLQAEADFCMEKDK